MKGTDGTLFLEFLTGVGAVAAIGMAAFGAALQISELTVYAGAAAFACGLAFVASVWAAGTTDIDPGEDHAMNAIELLHADHLKLREMLAACERASDPAEREARCRRIVRELDAHEAIEEEIFYPALQEHERTRELALEGSRAHQVADAALGDVSDVAADDEQWPAKFRAFKEVVERHIAEEERTMFESAAEVFSSWTLEELGDEMEERKGEIMPEAA